MTQAPSDVVDLPAPTRDEAATEKLVATAAEIRANPELTSFESRQHLARLLGAHHDPDTGLTGFGFWAPELGEQRIVDKIIQLHLFTPVDDIDFTRPLQAATFHHCEVPLIHDGDYLWAVVDGIRAGNAERAGSFYWVQATTPAGETITVHDLLADSVPYGSFAPAEVYDMITLQRNRVDLDHFATDPTPPTSILELHIPTATAGGTLADLAETYRAIGDKQRRGRSLDPAEQVYVNYDAIQPLPVDPTIERPGASPTFSVVEQIDEMAGLVGVLLRHPENRNWGYDTVVASSSAVNPSLLRTRRPDELVALAEALHALPEPMMLIYDLVYGHADNQALQVLPSRFFKGPNMYGQDLNHQDPTVRAILLEMQRRRVNTGCDGLRVDGAQDFKFYDPRAGQVAYDDDYLRSMSDVPQEIGPHTRHMWMIFEDGRPWPDEGWETSSSYRDVIELQPDTYQWGPLIFAHNTPMLDGFWSDKWWRVEQIIEYGGNWISGCANHDTVRRGTQVDPDKPINRFLGDDLPTILDNAYDNAAVTAVSYALLPGIPMDFLQATTRTPWAFMRTTDDVYGVKVMCEEAGFLDWQMTDGDYRRSDVMWRTKRHGLTSRSELRTFLGRIGELVATTDYDLETIAAALARDAVPDGLRHGAEGLGLLAFDFMTDVHELCNVGRHLDRLDPERVAFATAMRVLRRRLPWLGHDCRDDDLVEKVEKIARTAGDHVVYRGHRISPDGSVVVATVANMAGSPVRIMADEVLTVDRSPWPQLNSATATRRIVSPGVEVDEKRLTLPDGTGVVYLWENLL